MRRVRTAVLPVPAPASTNMGPRRCSIASRWRSSGANWRGCSVFLAAGIGRCISEKDEEICRAVMTSWELLQFRNDNRCCRNHRSLGEEVVAVEICYNTDSIWEYL